MKPFLNPFARLQPSQRQMAQAREDGVDPSNAAAFDRWKAEKREGRATIQGERQ